MQAVLKIVASVPNTTGPTNTFCVLRERILLMIDPSTITARAIMALRVSQMLLLPFSLFLPPPFHSSQAEARSTAFFQPANSFPRTSAAISGWYTRSSVHWALMSPRSFQTPVAKPAR